MSIYGQERVDETLRLCKMNLAVHGLEGQVSQSNTYYEDPFKAAGQFDYVMANPPFNVNKVDKTKLEGDKRFPFGLPKTDNGNYIWIQAFYSALNDEGRAGFVMANSAGDAGGSELEIRKKLIAEKAVDVVVAVGSNFFYTVTLPVTLWFLDRGKRGTKREDRVLLIDARKIFRQIDRAHRDWLPEQIEFLANIARLYRGEQVETAEGSADLMAAAFPDGAYVDVPGLCAIASREDIEKQGWSLNPGRYVGFAAAEDDGIDFRARLDRVGRGTGEAQHRGCTATGADCRECGGAADRMTSLDALCELIVDCEHKTAPTVLSGFPLIRTPDIGVGRLDVEGARRVDEETYRAWTRRAVPRPGDLILAREAPVGNVGPVPPGVQPALGQRTVLIRTRADVLDPMYLNYLLSGPQLRGWMDGVASGATVPHLNVADIRSMELPPLPPLPTQRKIATILSAYDDLIENNHRRIKLLEEMVQRIHREWFVDFRYPGHEGVRLADSELGPVPEGWAIRPLAAVCARITDGAHHSPPATAEGLPMASVKDMTPRRLDLATCRHIEASDYEALVRQDCRPRINDILIAKDGSYLKHVFVVRRDEDVVILSSIALLRPNKRLAPDVLALYLKQTETKERLKGFVSGVAIPRIVLKDFRVFPVLVPPESVQRAFVERVGTFLHLALALDEASAGLGAARCLLLPRLISGEIDVADLDVAMPDLAA